MRRDNGNRRSPLRHEDRKSMPSRSWRLSSSKLLYRSRAIGWCPDQTFVSVMPHVFVECTNDCERTTLSNAIAGSCVSEPSRKVFSGVMPGQCPLWVKSRHVQCKKECLLYPGSGQQMVKSDSGSVEFGVPLGPTNVSNNSRNWWRLNGF